MFVTVSGSRFRDVTRDPSKALILLRISADGAATRCCGAGPVEAASPRWNWFRTSRSTAISGRTNCLGPWCFTRIRCISSL